MTSIYKNEWNISLHLLFLSPFVFFVSFVVLIKAPGK